MEEQLEQQRISSAEELSGDWMLEELMKEFTEYPAPAAPVTGESLESNDGSERRLAALSKRQLRFLSDVKICAGIELGEIELSVQQLLDIVEGSVFDFEFEPTRPVLLRIGEEEIAKARFVMKDERLALEIVAVCENLIDKE